MPLRKISAAPPGCPASNVIRAAATIERYVMKIWTDERGSKWCEPDCYDEWLFDIWAIGCDYDGETTVEGLKKLVDQLVSMSQKARDCLHGGKLFPEDKTQV